jgi:hypothetical protein
MLISSSRVIKKPYAIICLFILGINLFILTLYLFIFYENKQLILIHQDLLLTLKKQNEEIRDLPTLNKQNIYLQAIFLKINSVKESTLLLPVLENFAEQLTIYINSTKILNDKQLNLKLTASYAEQLKFLAFLSKEYPEIFFTTINMTNDNLELVFHA